MEELVELMHRMQEGVDVRTRIDVLNPYRQCFKVRVCYLSKILQ